MITRKGGRPHSRPHWLLVLVATAGALVVSGSPEGSAQSAGDPSSWFLPLGDLPGGAFLSLAHDISDDGSVIVGESESSEGTEAFVWTRKAGMSGLSDLPGGAFRSVANGVSGDGTVVGGYSQATASLPSGHEAFRWTADSGMEPLGDLPGGTYSSLAFATSEDGSVLGGKSDPATVRKRRSTGAALQGCRDWATWPADSS